MYFKKIYLIILVALLFVLSTSISGETNTLCSYKGPDISEDSLELTKLIIIGPFPLKEGDMITVKFNLQNKGRTEIELGKKGIFVAAIDPNQKDASFGFSYTNKVIKGGETLSIEVSKTLDKTGSWEIWPSYHISSDKLRVGEKFGPSKWHSCSLAVVREDIEEEPEETREVEQEPKEAVDDGDRRDSQEEEILPLKETEQEPEVIKKEEVDYLVDDDIVDTETIIEKQGLTVDVLTCIYSVSGNISAFPYDRDTLKIKTCPDPISVSRKLPNLKDIKICSSEASVRYSDVLPGIGDIQQLTRSYSYQIGGLCPDTTYLLQPVYYPVEDKCAWKGSFDYKTETVTIGKSSISGRNFSFTAVETKKPQVTITHNSLVPRESNTVSTGDNIAFNVSGSDSSGIARIQIFQRLGYKTEDNTIGYDEEELIHECQLSNNPSSGQCAFTSGPYPEVDAIEFRGVVCDINGNLSSKKEQISLTRAHCFNGVRDADEQGIDCGGSYCPLCLPTCDDGIQNRDEEGVDCGGSWCPPCSQCDTGAKWAPHDTPCKNHWPTNEGPQIGMNTHDNSCSIIEVCHPELDYIVEDAITCCENSDFETRFLGHRAEEKKVACQYARTISGVDTDYNQTSFKRCLGVYPISGLGGAAAYMQGYFSGEVCCYGNNEFCPPECSKWSVNPAAWEMGTAMSCAGAEGVKPDFQMAGHRCVYNQSGLCSIHCWREGLKGYWKSDTDYTKNNDSFADVPAHASINQLSTGTCVDYSFALTTILRKLGYSKDDVLSVSGDKHAYNLVRFPGVMNWSYVDTVGNRAGEIFGGIGYSKVYEAGNLSAWYDYCKNMNKGCSNDYYSQKTGNCPANDQIYSCEGIPR